MPDSTPSREGADDDSRGGGESHSSGSPLWEFANSPAFERLVQDQRALVEPLIRQINIAAQFQRNFEAAAESVLRTSRVLDSIREEILENWKSLSQSLLRPEIRERLIEAARQAMPPNLRDVPLSDQMSAVAMAGRHRLGVYGALPPDLVCELARLDGSENEGTQVEALVAKVGETELAFLSTQIEIMSELADDEQSGQGELLQNAVLAFRQGNYPASQALSTVVYDTLYTAIFSDKAVSKAKLRISSLSDKTQTLNRLYENAVLEPIVETYHVPKSSTLYGRNLTVHFASPGQLNRHNAFCSLTLAIGLFVWRQVLGR